MRPPTHARPLATQCLRSRLAAVSRPECNQPFIHSFIHSFVRPVVATDDQTELPVGAGLYTMTTNGSEKYVCVTLAKQTVNLILTLTVTVLLNSMQL